jgi:hypothetical protein
MIQPDGHVRPHLRGRTGVVAEARELVGLDLAIRQATGQGLVERDPQRVEVAAGIGAGRVVGQPLLRVDVAGGAGVQAAQRFGLAARDRHPQVEQAPLAIVTPMQVGRLDVAMDHALPVQPAQGPEHGATGVHDLAHVEAAAVGDQLLQGLPAVPVIDDVEGARLLELMHPHQAALPVARHAAAQPGLVRQHRALFRVARPGFVQGLDRHQGLRGRAARLVEPMHAVVGQHRRDGVAVQHVTHAQFRRHGQLATSQQQVLQPACRKPGHTDHQGGGVVAAAGIQGGLHQRLAGRLGRTFSRPCGQFAPAQHTMHPVGGEHEDVAPVQLALAVVDPHMVVQADRPGQGMAQVGVIEAVILAELDAIALAQQPGSRVTHVRQGVAVPTQHQRRERAHGGAFAAAAPVVASQPGVLRPDEPVQRHRGVPGFGHAMEVLQQAHHRGLRGQSPLAAAGDTVSHRGDQPTRLIVGRGAHHRGEILVVLAGAARAGVADVDLETHERMGRGPQAVKARHCSPKCSIWQAPKRCTPRLHGTFLVGTSLAFSARGAFLTELGV